MDLLDRQEDHRRGALHGPVMYLDEPLLDWYGLADRAGDSSPRPSTYCRSARWHKQLKRVH